MRHQARGVSHSPRNDGTAGFLGMRWLDDDLRLADGRPLWHALLDDPDVLVMRAADERRARALLRSLLRIEPEVVRKCVGRSLEEARWWLRSIVVEE